MSWRNFIKGLMATDTGKHLVMDILDQHQSVPQNLPMTMAVAGWSNVCDGNSQIGCVVVYMTARVSESISDVQT